MKKGVVHQFKKGAIQREFYYYQSEILIWGIIQKSWGDSFDDSRETETIHFKGHYTKCTVIPLTNFKAYVC